MSQNVTSPFRVPRGRIQAISSPDGHTMDLSALLSTAPSTVKTSNSNSNSNAHATTSKTAAARPSASDAVSGKRKRTSKGCMCRQSKCIKLYCDCFRGQRYCTADCSCAACENVPDNEGQLAAIREAVLARNQDAFLQTKKSSEPPKCSCTKSRCLNRYCECIRAGRLCTNACRCNDCNNAKACSTDMPYDAAESLSMEHLDLFQAFDWQT